MTLFSMMLVGAGGFFGAISRYSLSQYINKNYSFRLPVATLIINLTGSFLLGFIISLGLGDSAVLLLGTGFMGAFTTFSTFKIEGIQLHLSKRKKDFLLYNLYSYGGGILLAFLGMAAGHLLAK